MALQTAAPRVTVNINIEFYDCDPVFSDAKLASLEHRRKIRPYLKHFDSIRHYQEFEKVKFKFDPIQKVFESILGKSVVEECQKKAKERFTKALAARKAWKEVTAPVEKNTKAKRNFKLRVLKGRSNASSGFVPGLLGPGILSGAL